MEYPPPPPPPTAGVNAPVSTSLPRRQRIAPAQPPSIATNLARTLAAPTPTPHSGSSHGSGTTFFLTPTTPGVLYPQSPGMLAPPASAISPRTPAMEPYDPRQWSSRGQVSGSQMVFQHRPNGLSTGTREATGMEDAMPSPPPPYSPEVVTGSDVQPARPVSMLEGFGLVASPVPNSATASPQLQISPNFPPPPHASRFRERSASGQRGFFSLSNLRKSTANIDVQAVQMADASDVVEPTPPAAKRAASTGQIHPYQPAEASSAPIHGPARKASPGSSWKPGMPLPGPPPGPPPPSGSRTQSLNRYPESSSRSNSIGSESRLEVSQSRRGAAAGSSLGPVPPTPADWVDTDAAGEQPTVPPLRIDTGAGHEAALTRRPAKRDSTGYGIRERRSRSRAAKDGFDVMSPEAESSRPDDLILAPSDGSIRRRRDHKRGMSNTAEHMTGFERGAGQVTQQDPTKATNNVLTPPYTPAVGNSNDESLRRLAFKTPGSASSDRPISQVLHQSAGGSNVPAALSPARPTSNGSAKISARLDPFFLQALERHRSFIEREASAATDEERLELFASYLVSESRLRRDRYAGAYNAMAGEIVDLTRDMWRSYGRQGKRAMTPSTVSPGLPSWASDAQQRAAYRNMPSSASSYGDFTPATDTASLVGAGENMERSDSRQRGDAFKPSLSPIPSMAVSTVADEESSRGRAPSRWWENSNSGSNSIGRPERIEKSHRETKYMGVTPADLQVSDEQSPRNSWHTGSTPGPSLSNFGPNDYPPEKVGWHEATDVETPMPTPGRPRKTSTPGATPLDVSRLITLPPPYPRHHPAVKNKHPLLSDLRNEYRALADHTKIEEIREAYTNQDVSIQQQQDEAVQERRNQLRSGIQARIADGTMSYAEAAQAEADFQAEEANRGESIARSNFDVFEATLAHPLNRLLTERLEKANVCIHQLRGELESRNEISDPNQAQEEGDEQPERLEKLTLLKWFFEVREQLHKEMYDLHASRSAKYSEVILTPFRLAKQQAKIDDASAFFKKDDLDRQISFAKDSLRRFEELQQVMDLNVSRGVEDQLSAFWDIAPGLLEVIQQIPADMAELEIQIPEQEYLETPAFNEHPLQYLHSLLGHAQKSAYQFIESQTNLLCLLHEVRTATMKSSLRLVEIEKTAANPNDEHLRAKMSRASREREDGLTADLKEKVGEVERQWQEALGEVLEQCREKVRAFLEETGGWEEGLEE